MIQIFALRTTPFTWTKFAFFMAALAGLCAVSLLIDRRGQIHEVDPIGAASQPSFDIVRFGRPAADVFAELPQVGLPWFLRRQGVTGRFEDDGDMAFAIELRRQDKIIGRFLERVVAIDDDRSRLYVAFVASDPVALAELARPIQTRFDPVTLMRVVMLEHTRSSLNGDGFDLYVLEGGIAPLVSLIAKFLRGAGPCPPPTTDNFALCGQDLEAAALRRVYGK